MLALDLDPADVVRQRVFYGQSAALVGWLIERCDGPTLLRFLHEAARHGTERALAAHYDLHSIDTLEQAWLARDHASAPVENLTARPVMPSTEERSPCPSSPPVF